MRVRAYSTGPATQLAPVQLTTQISGGKAKKVVYKLDGRKLKSKRGRTWKSAITPSKLRKIGIHTLKTTVTGRKKRSKGKVVVLKLKTTPCSGTLFTAQRWRTTAGAGLRLRIDARTAIKGVAFTVAKPLLPRTLRKQRTIGFMRVFVAGEGKNSPLLAEAAQEGRQEDDALRRRQADRQARQGRPPGQRAARPRGRYRAHALPREEARRRHQAPCVQAQGTGRARGSHAQRAPARAALIALGRAARPAPSASA